MFSASSRGAFDQPKSHVYQPTAAAASFRNRFKRKRKQQPRQPGGSFTDTDRAAAEALVTDAHAWFKRVKQENSTAQHHSSSGSTDDDLPVAAKWAVGCLTMLQGLTSRVDLNGKIGRVVQTIGRKCVLALYETVQAKCSCKVLLQTDRQVRIDSDQLVPLGVGRIGRLIGLSGSARLNGTSVQITDYLGAGRYVCQPRRPSAAKPISVSSQNIEISTTCSGRCPASIAARHEKAFHRFVGNQAQIQSLKDVPWPSKEVLQSQLRSTKKPETTRLLRVLRKPWHPDKFLQEFGSRIQSAVRRAILARTTEIMAFINNNTTK